MRAPVNRQRRLQRAQRLPNVALPTEVERGSLELVRAVRGAVSVLQAGGGPRASNGGGAAAG